MEKGTEGGGGKRQEGKAFLDGDAINISRGLHMIAVIAFGAGHEPPVLLTCKSATVQSSCHHTRMLQPSIRHFIFLYSS